MTLRFTQHLKTIALTQQPLDERDGMFPGRELACRLDVIDLHVAGLVPTTATGALMLPFLEFVWSCVRSTRCEQGLPSRRPT